MLLNVYVNMYVHICVSSSNRGKCVTTVLWYFSDLSDNTVMTANDATDAYSIEYLSVGTYTFECTVTDSQGNNDTESIMVRVIQG